MRRSLTTFFLPRWPLSPTALMGFTTAAPPHQPDQWHMLLRRLSVPANKITQPTLPLLSASAKRTIRPVLPLLSARTHTVTQTALLLPLDRWFGRPTNTTCSLFVRHKSTSVEFFAFLILSFFTSVSLFYSSYRQMLTHLISSKPRAPGTH